MTDLVTGEAVVLDVPCARFPSRMVALILDMIVQVLLVTVVVLIAGAAGAKLNAASTAAVGVTAVVLIIVGYPATFETLTRGRTPGKMALGLRVVSDDGGPERFRQALVRALAGVIEIWLFTGAPALICSLLTARGKRLGDLFAGTFVIQERLPRRKALPAALAVVPAPLAGWAQLLEVSGLRDQTAEAASSYLRRYDELTPAARAEFGQRIGAAVAAQVTPAPPPGTPAAAFLAAVLAVRREREAARLAMLRPEPAAPAQPAPAPPRPAPTVPAPTVPAPPAAAPPAGQFGRPVAGEAAEQSPSPSAGRPGRPGRPDPPAARPEFPDSGQFAPPV